LYRERWLNDLSNKQFELCLLFYNEEINDSSLYSDVDHFYHLRDYKYQMLFNLLTQLKPGWLEEFDYFYFLDDDIDLCTVDINTMFENARLFHADICQAALSHDSFCSWPIFKQEKACFCRFVGQIEVMAPLFSRDALKICLHSFIANKSSWGMDSVWSKLLDYPEDKLIVFDNVAMRHTMPVGNGELYQKLGVSPHEEWTTIAKQFGAKKHYYKELGRLQYVNKRYSRLSYLNMKFFDRLRDVKRTIRDFGLVPRLKSRTSRFVSLFGYRPH
jgi:hypothetical protein